MYFFLHLEGQFLFLKENLTGMKDPQTPPSEAE